MKNLKNKLNTNQKLIIYIIGNKNAYKINTYELIKILWYTDMFMFLTYKKQLTNYIYKKYPIGPFDEEINHDIQKLCDMNIIEYSQKPIETECIEFKLKQSPVKINFSVKQTDIINKTIKDIKENYNQYFPYEKVKDKIWETAEDFAEIQISTYLYAYPAPEEIDKDDIDWAKSCI